ncbi:MAG: hypothetical protein R3B40_20835 [Polyangiales bacterium]
MDCADLAAPFRVPAPDAVGPSIVRVNIYRPHAVAHVIRAALADGWRPDSTRRVRVIDDGLPLLHGYVG